MTASNERDPLLREDNEDEESLKEVKKITPLPKRQLFILCGMRFSEPVSYNLIFPFINQMLESVGIENPGYYSGLIEGTFAFAQLCTVYFWGSVSDRIGRRPVLLCGLLGVALFTTLFGLSRSFLMILVFRFLGGACNGNVAVLKSAIAELTDETNQGRAFSFLPFSWSAGSVAAPIIGGFLARPAEQFPSVFGHWKLFVDYPYLLPCLAGATITMIGWTVGFLFLEETLGGIENRKPPASSSASSVTAVTPPSYGATSSSCAPNPSDPATALATDRISEEPRRMTAIEIVKDVYIRRILIAYVFLAVLTSSIDALWVLWLYMPIPKGGVGFMTSEIGIILSANGVLATFSNLIVFPPLQRRLGTAPLYRAAMVLNVFMVSLFPIVSRVAEWETTASLVATGPGLGTKSGVGLMVIIKSTANLVFACNMILVSQSAPSRTSLGAINGVAQMVASATRSLGPSIATFLFALSTDPKYHFVGGQLIWLYMLSLALSAVAASTRVQEGRGPISEDMDN